MKLWRYRLSWIPGSAVSVALDGIQRRHLVTELVGVDKNHNGFKTWSSHIDLPGSETGLLLVAKTVDSSPSTVLPKRTLLRFSTEDSANYWLEGRLVSIAETTRDEILLAAGRAQRYRRVRIATMGVASLSRREGEPLLSGAILIRALANRWMMDLRQELPGTSTPGPCPQNIVDELCENVTMTANGPIRPAHVRVTARTSVPAKQAISFDVDLRLGTSDPLAHQWFLALTHAAQMGGVGLHRAVGNGMVRVVPTA
ncbi:hypothetical protein [Dietzia sp. SYD-A1]|uniref:hypothetical protein n=1 Tax=Dietzia sp. SYD-A1 TaxID=2780141 RepID=UPI001891A667|nr:hypothetical protein [Dietzia sp. SYD-A1]